GAVVGAQVGRWRHRRTRSGRGRFSRDVQINTVRVVRPQVPFPTTVRCLVSHAELDIEPVVSGSVFGGVDFFFHNAGPVHAPASLIVLIRKVAGSAIVKVGGGAVAAGGKSRNPLKNQKGEKENFRQCHFSGRPVADRNP